MFKTSIILSIIVLILAAAASAGGLMLPGLYRDNALVAAAMRGNDLITLVIAVPLMILSLIQVQRGSVRAVLVWMGLLFYMVYNYIFYLYGTAFNPFFLLYAALIPLSILALVAALPRIDAPATQQAFSRRTPVRRISAWMVFFAVMLGGMWIAMSLAALAAGQVPGVCLQTGHPTCVVFATDLSLLVPGLLAAAVMLWKRQVWGGPFAAIMLVKANTYGLALLTMGVFGIIEAGEYDPFTPLWVFLTAGCLVATWFLFANLRPASAGSPMSKSPALVLES